MSMKHKNTNETICINPKGGRAGIPGLQPSLQDRIYDINGIATACTVCFNPNILENYSLVSNSKSFKEIKEKGEKIMDKPKLSVVSLFSGSGFQEMGVKNCVLLGNHQN